MTDAADVTRLLERIGRGDGDAADELLREVYDELHAMAAQLFRSQGAGHTLQATALVHEAWLKMARPRDGEASWQDRTHFYAVAARAMRQVLINHARDRGRAKRGGGAVRRRLTLHDPAGATGLGALDLIGLDEALEELRHLDERQYRITELRIFAGLSVKETAAILGIAPRTVVLDWSMAKSFLARRLEPGGGSGPT